MSEALVVTIIGLISPPVIDFINRFVPNSYARYLISLVLSFVIGGLLAYAEYGADVLQNATLIFAAQQTAYKLMYDNSRLQTKVRG